MEKIKNKFEKTGPMRLPSRIGAGTFNLYLYLFPNSGYRYFVLERGRVRVGKNVLVRIDSNCVWADLFGSARCDCAEQMHEAMRKIIKENNGLLIHAYDQDGRGLSLQDHVRVYMEQDKGYDTIEADKKCGFEIPDRRDYSETVQILEDYHLSNIRLLTNNPDRIKVLNEAGFKVKREGIEPVPLDKYNAAQLYKKKESLGHLYSFDLNDPRVKSLFKESLKKWSHDEYDSYIWETLPKKQ